jgi:prevent-host-death family protein
MVLGWEKVCQNISMREMSVKQFRASCLAVLDRVQQTKEPVLIIKQGRPVAKLIPVKESQAEEFLGRLEGIVQIIGEIEAPIWTIPLEC